MPHLCQDLPGHNHNLDRLERYKTRHALDEPASCTHAGLPGCRIGHHGNGHGKAQDGQDDRDRDAARAVLRTFAALKAQLFCVPFAAYAAICVQNGVPKSARRSMSADNKPRHR